MMCAEVWGFGLTGTHMCNTVWFLEEEYGILQDQLLYNFVSKKHSVEYNFVEGVLNFKVLFYVDPDQNLILKS